MRVWPCRLLVRVVDIPDQALSRVCGETSRRRLDEYVGSAGGVKDKACALQVVRLFKETRSLIDGRTADGVQTELAVYSTRDLSLIMNVVKETKSSR